MLRSLLSGGSIQDFLLTLLLSLPIIFLSLSVHETAHGYAAYRLGDPTAKNMGRLTLNPFKHFNPMGFLCMLLCGFGWANPVPIDTRYFKNPKRDMALSALAGPLSNLILAVLFALLLRLEYAVFSAVTLSGQLAYNLFVFLQTFCILGINLNITLAVFNLIPCPPLDGSRIFLSFLPPHQYFKVMRYEQYLSIALMVALFLGLLDTPIDFVSNLFLSLISRLIF